MRPNAIAALLGIASSESLKLATRAGTARGSRIIPRAFTDCSRMSSCSFISIALFIKAVTARRSLRLPRAAHDRPDHSGRRLVAARLPDRIRGPVRQPLPGGRGETDL